MNQLAEHFLDCDKLVGDGVKVYKDADEWSGWKGRGDPVLHIELRKWADVILVAPLSANTLAKVCTFGVLRTWAGGVTTLQSMMNAKLSPHMFWPCHENGLIKTIQTIPHNLYVSFKLASLYCGLRLILVYPNPQ